MYFLKSQRLLMPAMVRNECLEVGKMARNESTSAFFAPKTVPTILMRTTISSGTT